MSSISAVQAGNMRYFSNTNKLLEVSSNYSSDVKDLQQDLTTLGYSTNGVDGYFGNNTKLAVLSFQRDYGLSQDGIAGNETLSKINYLINQAKNQNSQSISNNVNIDTVSISGNLFLGMQGIAISDLQSALTKLGYDTYGVDGVFGQNTKSAVIAFQRDNGLTQDGIVGNQTKDAISAAISAKTMSISAISIVNNLKKSTALGDRYGSRVLKSGVTGDDVKNLQSDLKTLGYLNDVVDGDFGSKTEAAVIAFQKAHGLDADGQVGDKTKAELVSSMDSYAKSHPGSSGGSTGVNNSGSNTSNV
ncbi:MAG: peptidoglycan-binding protein, partial [Bacillota bacterium]|nr:peptidoglycan-binding protein [Bacillota bacterium]